MIKPIETEQAPNISESHERTTTVTRTHSTSPPSSRLKNSNLGWNETKHKRRRNARYIFYRPFLARYFPCQMKSCAVLSQPVAIHSEKEERTDKPSIGNSEKEPTTNT